MIEDVYIIPLKRWLVVTYTRSFLLTCDGEMVLVDAGYSPKSAEAILDYVRKMGRRPEDVSLCILTHHHWDHVGGLKDLKRACGFKVASHASEADDVKLSTGVEVDLKLDDGDTIPYCGGIRIVHVPGHTKGNICLFLEGKKALITGDTLFASYVREELKPPPERFCEDAAMARKELKKLLDLDVEAVLVSHGKVIYSDGKEKLRALIQKIS